MITGTVNAQQEAIIRLSVQSVAGQEQEIETVIDTGFTGYLTLPPSLISSLGLPWIGRQQGMLADGSFQLFDVYTATVSWDGQLVTIEVDSSDTMPLLGMGMISGYELRIQAIEGGLVTLEIL